MMFDWFKKKSDAPKVEKPRRKGPFYIYKPFENAMSYRVEYRDGRGYVYPGWAKTLLFKIEEDKIYSAADEKQSYIIIGKDVYDGAGERAVFRLSGGAVYTLPGRELLYEIRDSITVQGTL